MSGKRKRQKGSGKEYGKNLIKCHIYKTHHIREKNKIRKILKYLRKAPNDKQSAKRVEELREFIKT